MTYFARKRRGLIMMIRLDDYCPPKTKMDPQNDGFQKESAFSGVYVRFRGCR